MKLETFFEKFDELADTPDGVKSMRELVLRLAFSGGLTGRRPTETGVPDGWETRTIESISASISSGFACSRSHQVENGHVHLRTHNISTLGTLNFDLLVRIDPTMVDPQKASIRAGDILFNNTNSQELVGKTSLVDREYDYGFSNHITRIRLKDGVFPGFVVFYLTLLRNSGYFARLCTRWINQAAVNTNTLKEQMIPLPPLAEQKRIAAKVDELMALCDRLEEQLQERETQHAALARAALARFAEAPTPANLEFLFHNSYAISSADLRKSILTLAVQGKLLPQNPRDQSASETLAQLEASGGNSKIRRSVPTDVHKPDTLDEENLPYSWCIESIARLLQLGVIRDLKDGNHGANHPKVAEFTESGLPFITAAQVSEDGRIDYDGAYKVSGEPRNRLRVGFAKPNDVIYTHKGSVGRVAICHRECVLTPQTTYYRVNEEALSSRYLRIYLLSPLFRSQVDLVKRQTTRDFVSINAQYQFFLRVPPIAEQHRIAERVDQLLKLVDQLEYEVMAARIASSNLLDAMVRELTSLPSKLTNGVAGLNASMPATGASVPSRQLARAALSAEIVHRLHNEPTFGRVKHQKILHLCEHIAQLKEIDGRYSRQAAGPLDGRMIHNVEADVKKLQWYAEVPRESFGHAYQPLAKAGGHAIDFAALWSDRAEQIQGLIELMRRWDTDKCELFSTAYAAWNDLLIWGREPTDDAILHEILERWHPDKKRFPRKRWKSMLDWIRREGYAPTGFGKATTSIE